MPQQNNSNNNNKDLLLKDFKLPKSVVFEKDEINENYGRFIIAPFERGFGTTIANSLRRTLLSSIQGYAITAIRIVYSDKNRNSIVLTNEFEAIYGMYEETLDFIQNLKQLRIKIDNEEEENRTIIIEKQGDYVLKGADLETDPNIKVYNPDLYLATLNEDAHITIEMQIDYGRGYVPAERNIEYEKAISTIPIDAIFTPVLKVNYEIENYRVGQRTDYDKVIMEIWTDGTIGPDDALSNSARILREYYKYFLNIEEKIEEIEPEEPKVSKEEKEREKLNSKPIEDLNLSVRSSNCLRVANIKTLGELGSKSEEELNKIKNLGKKSLDEIKEKLASYGFDVKSEEQKK